MSLATSQNISATCPREGCGGSMRLHTVTRGPAAGTHVLRCEHHPACNGERDQYGSATYKERLRELGVLARTCTDDRQLIDVAKTFSNRGHVVEVLLEAGTPWTPDLLSFVLEETASLKEQQLKYLAYSTHIDSAGLSQLLGWAFYRLHAAGNPRSMEERHAGVKMVFEVVVCLIDRGVLTWPSEQANQLLSFALTRLSLFASSASHDRKHMSLAALLRIVSLPSAILLQLAPHAVDGQVVRHPNASLEVLQASAYITGQIESDRLHALLEHPAALHDGFIRRNLAHVVQHVQDFSLLYRFGRLANDTDLTIARNQLEAYSKPISEIIRGRVSSETERMGFSSSLSINSDSTPMSRDTALRFLGVKPESPAVEIEERYFHLIGDLSGREDSFSQRLVNDIIEARTILLEPQKSVNADNDVIRLPAHLWHEASPQWMRRVSASASITNLLHLENAYFENSIIRVVLFGLDFSMPAQGFRSTHFETSLFLAIENKTGKFIETLTLGDGILVDTNGRQYRAIREFSQTREDGITDTHHFGIDLAPYSIVDGFLCYPFFDHHSTKFAKWHLRNDLYVGERPINMKLKIRLD